VNWTVPVGTLPPVDALRATIAVNVTHSPTCVGSSSSITVIVVEPA